jgi:hypothetical protein
MAGTVQEALLSPACFHRFQALIEHSQCGIAGCGTARNPTNYLDMVTIAITLTKR